YGFEFQFLQLFCTRIFVMPTSSASSECNWSAYAHIHTKKQNRLTNKRLEELVYIYWNLRVIYKNNDKKIGEVEDESVWLSDIEQEVNNEETNFWESFDKLADQ
ncbi:14075_t:CDS:1, partial [Cetraspora pellucida]